MGINDQSSQRLFVVPDLSTAARIWIDAEQTNYLVTVLRARAGTKVRIFNGRDGEWIAFIGEIKKRSLELVVESQARPQIDGPDVEYYFAPLKRARLDYVVQKATEMGVSRIAPVLTRRTVAERVNIERMRANVIEAAEQCGVLRIPRVDEPRTLIEVLDDWDQRRRLVFCDEEAPMGRPLAVLEALPQGPLALLIGPEGGFDTHERAELLAKPWVTQLSLGPRIMRADTAAVSALALVNATLGDWR